MTNHNTLFYNLTQFVGTPGVRFPDLRLAATYVWAVIGLIIGESIHLGQWALFRPGKAKAASKARQFSRWLHNDRIRPLLVYRPLVEKMLQEYGGKTLYLGLDTTLLWNRFVIVRLALVYRGRVLPLGWVVRASGSATVAVACYQRMLAQVAAVILAQSQVILLADRGFFHVRLMPVARQLGWHFRIRVKPNILVHRATKGQRTVRAHAPTGPCPSLQPRLGYGTPFWTGPFSLGLCPDPQRLRTGGDCQR